MSESSNRAGGKHEPMLPYVVAWLVLVLLLGVSTLSAYLDLGFWHPIVNFGIAATQAAIIFIIFMRLRGRPSIKWFVAGAGFFWLLFLYGLSMVDYATRTGFPS